MISRNTLSSPALVAAEGDGANGRSDAPRTSRSFRRHRDLVGAADRFFYRLGYRVAFSPNCAVFIAVLVVFLCCLAGLVDFTGEADGQGFRLPGGGDHAWFGECEARGCSDTCSAVAFG